MRNFNKGFIIGLIEGEGSIGLAKTSKTKSGRQSYNPTITITNTNLSLLEKARKIIGAGHIYQVIPKRAKNGFHRKVIYHFHLTGTNQVLPFLKKIEPLLIGKKQRARLVLEWSKSRKNRGAKPNREVPYNKRELEVIDLIKKV